MEEIIIFTVLVQSEGDEKEWRGTDNVDFFKLCFNRNAGSDVLQSVKPSL